jgi:hypothetical protein
MTTFEKIKDEETPTIDVSGTRVISDIDPLIYGGFME